MSLFDGLTSEESGLYPTRLFEVAAERKVREVPPVYPVLGNQVPIYSVKLCRTGDLRVREKVQNPSTMCSFLWPLFAEADRELVAVVLLDTHMCVIGVNVASVGDLSSAIIHPREVFKPAVIASACSIVVAHNHPSGDLTPSSEDRSICRRLVESGDVLGITVQDFLVIAGRNRYVSFREKALM
jgi:DNA repair protein RadC